MDKVLRYIYETTVDKQIEEPKVEIREENGEKIEVKKTVKTVKPIKLAILKPDRKLYKGAEIFYAKSLSEYLKIGLMPYSLVAKRYANDGGVLTNLEAQKLENLKAESRELEAIFYSVITSETEEDRKKKNDALRRINEINTEVNNISNVYSDIYDNTAEIKSRNDTIEWWVLNLLYIEDEKGFKPFFGEGTYEDKIQKLEATEEGENPFELEVIKKLSYLISFWFTAKNSTEKLDFDSMDKLYKEDISTYKVETSEATKISEVK